MMISCMSTVTSDPYYYTAKPSVVKVGRVIPIWIDREFTDGERSSIDQAIDRWNYGLNGSMKLVVRSREFSMLTSEILDVLENEGWIILRVSESNSEVKLVDGVPSKLTLAWVDSVGGYKVSVVHERVRSEWLFGVMLHELGHLLGADHNSEHLMGPYFDIREYSCIDYAAMRLVSEYQHINMVDLNYCIYN